ncbi:MAG: type III-B CRISPR module-associated Cmr3 family protein [Rhodocyclaceae bacterium]|nr:type III-B CRISPR module-associated Cmr3 family protein [Rhodocyclaceae bacterium]
MSAVEYRFIEPLDVLFLRGNKLFGDPGSYGESLVPPWPSVAAGSLRSRMLADEGVDLPAFAAGRVSHPTLGTPEKPGTFAITLFSLARRMADCTVEPLFISPADLVIAETEGQASSIRRLIPAAPAKGVSCSAPLPLLPVLAEEERGKPAGGYWLTASAWRDYLAGGTPKAGDVIKSGELWRIDPRVGVGLDAATGRAADGRLFSVQAVAMRKREHLKQDGFDVGFLAGVSGAVPASVGMLRLGGDGRAAAVHPAKPKLPEVDYAAIAAARRCRIILTSPGIFPGGWALPGEDGRFSLGGVSGQVVCAAVPRAEVVSGWDLARWQPKPARRAAPAGSVYWLEDLEASPETLRKLADTGLWLEPCEDAQRRAEGFNRFVIAPF